MTIIKVLIAGATGTIGKPPFSLLREAGHELFALVGAPKFEDTFEGNRAHQVVADVPDAASVLDVIQRTQQDVIINEFDFSLSARSS